MIGEFAIRPNEGAGPLRFGMSVAEVEAILGTNGTRMIRRSQSKALHYKGVTVEFDVEEEKLVWIAFDDSVVVSFKGINVFSVKDVAALIELFGQDAFEGVGYAAFPELCIACDDFDSVTSPERFVCMFKPGTWWNPEIMKVRRRFTFP